MEITQDELNDASNKLADVLNKYNVTEEDFDVVIRKNAESQSPKRIHELPVREVMTQDPDRISVGQLASAGVHILHDKKHNQLPVVDGEGRPVGIVDIQDILGVV